MEEKSEEKSEQHRNSSEARLKGGENYQGPYMYKVRPGIL
jgi:hypothetical protein